MTAAIIMTPFSHPNHQKMQILAPGFLKGVRELADRHGAVLIYDKIRTGFRISVDGAQKYSGVTPDISVLGKAIANGSYRIYINKPIRGTIRIHGRAFTRGVAAQLDMIAGRLDIEPRGDASDQRQEGTRGIYQHQFPRGEQRHEGAIRKIEEKAEWKNK